MDDGHARTGLEAQRLCASRSRVCVTVCCVSRIHRIAGIGEGINYPEAMEIRESGLASLWDVIKVDKHGAEAVRNAEDGACNGGAQLHCSRGQIPLELEVVEPMLHLLRPGALEVCVNVRLEVLSLGVMRHLVGMVRRSGDIL
eukprot:3019512-Prymnesium_polylepis.2